VYPLEFLGTWRQYNKKQRSASTEKPIKKIRKYISVRTQKINGDANGLAEKLDHALLF
jgi:hypothetical protein